MKFTRDLPADAATRMIRAYATGSITTTHEVLTRSSVLCGSAVADWRPLEVGALVAADLDALLAYRPEVVLIGTGPTLRFPPATVLAHAHAARVGVEVMDTAAACRTYNLLVSEGRRVVAGLIMI